MVDVIPYVKYNLPFMGSRTISCDQTIIRKRKLLISIVYLGFTTYYIYSRYNFDYMNLRISLLSMKDMIKDLAVVL